MIFRAQTANWFEVLVPRPRLARTLEALADSGLVELDFLREDGGESLQFHALLEPLAQWRRSQARYADYWPEPGIPAPQSDVQLERRLLRLAQDVSGWQAEAAPHVDRLEGLLGAQHEWHRLAEFLRAVAADDVLDFSGLSQPRSPLTSALLIVANNQDLPPWPDGVILKQVRLRRFRFLLALGPRRVLDELVRQLAGHAVHRVELPAWLSGPPVQALEQVEDHLRQAAADSAQEQQLIADLNHKYRLAQVLGELRRLEWLVEHLEGIPVSAYLARITGWTRASGEAQLADALRGYELAAVVGFAPPPVGLSPPTFTANPAWIRPFEMFVKLLGTPGQNEADPSPAVAVIAPCLFGYMFGDVGQGAVLFVLGVTLRKRWPMLGMLIPGGLLAVVFGLLFGSVFASEQLLRPLWVSPIHDPLLIMLVPLVGGAIIILLGLLFQALGALWSHHFLDWLSADAGIPLCYLGLLLSWQLADAGLLMALIGVLWFLAGSIWNDRKGGPAAWLGAVGELLERGMQLAVNTLSFIRVGAFALAHAGLSLAVMSLVEATDGGVAAGLIFILGNVLIMALEGLVVSIQTTRLILFEFFVRFVRGEGRPFRPLGPPTSPQINKREKS